MHQPLLGFLAFAVGTVVVLTVPVLAVWLLVHLLRFLGVLVAGGAKGVSAAVRHVARFVRGEVVDTVHFAGSVLTGVFIAPLAVANVAIGRFRAARHYGAALEDEFTSALVSLYRVGLGHPVRLVGLGALTDGLERRLPDLVAGEPRTARFAEAVRPKPMKTKRTLMNETPAFDGYQIHEELQAGGSGARLFRATPSAERANFLKTRNIDTPSQVVIKAFDIGYGSTIPQIVRESRSLEAAKRLGLILEHELSEDAFHYVMPFVPGRDLDLLTRELHAKSGTSGLDGDSLQQVVALARDLCAQLDRFHREGLWHKDIKPSNLLVADRRLHVVDFGLATPLESALTLTTHGTEFFRDPELVRLALAGKRVKDVDGVKFDLYSAGAVLYSMLENSFPAHGSLSSVTKRSPEAMRWIVRRAMADVDKRYPSAQAMARDLDVLALARDPYAVRPADLPSVNGSAPKESPRKNARPAPRQDWRAGAAAAGAAGAMHASFQPDADADQDPADVKRFNAFGSTVEVHGIGRLKSSVARRKNGRAERRRQRAEERESVLRARAADRAARAEQVADGKSRRRSRRRGMMKVVLILAIFAGIAGGSAEFMKGPHGRHAVVHGGEQFVQAPIHLAPNDVTVLWGSDEAGKRTSRGWSLMKSSEAAAFGSSIEQRIERLGKRPRVLVVADPFDKKLSGEAELAGKQLRTLGARPVGVALNAGSDLAPETLSLLADARYQIDRAGGSLESAMARLKRFTTEERNVDAVLWLQRHPKTGHLRTSLIDPRGTGVAEGKASARITMDGSGDESCSTSSASASTGRKRSTRVSH